MAQYTNTAVQVVATNQNVQFSETPVCSNKPCIVHRNGSGLVTLRGITNQCYARFRVSYNANIAIPIGGTVGAISIALAIDGEPLKAITATVTPAAVNNYFNVSGSMFVDVPKGCCLTIAVENTSGQPINVQNASLIIERVS